MPVVTAVSLQLVHGCRKIVQRGGMGKVGASSVFDSTTITEFVNQNSLFSFSLLTSDVARIFCYVWGNSVHTSIEFLRKNDVI